MYVNAETFHKLPCAGSGRALPCTRNFFEKKLSKSFSPLRRGMGALLPVFTHCPARQKDGGRGGFIRLSGWLSFTRAMPETALSATGKRWVKTLQATDCRP